MSMAAISRIRWRTTIPIFFILLALLLSMVFTIASHLSSLAASPAGAAPDGPGALSHHARIAWERRATRPPKCGSQLQMEF